MPPGCSVKSNRGGWAVDLNREDWLLCDSEKWHGMCKQLHESSGSGEDRDNHVESNTA